MLEVVNYLKKTSEIRETEDFLSYLSIYEDRKRNQALKKLLSKNCSSIKGRIGVEAGAGLGLITDFLLKLGPKKLYAVEENKLCYKILKEKFKNNSKVEVIYERIEDFKPDKKIDFLFQELYGPLLLDESILALERIKFKPEVVIPDGGLLLVEEVKWKDVKEKVLNLELLRFIKGALVTDLFPYFSFKNPSVLGKWCFNRKRKEVYTFEYKLKNKVDLIAFGMEILHRNKRVIGTLDSSNWPYVFTPVMGEKKFILSFKYWKGYSKVNFNWLN